jgi:hypothetical protein
MKKDFLQASQSSREFYYYLGLLSTKFAEVETNIMSIVGKLVIDEVFLINTIIEKNSLSQNIELLKKLNLYREFEQEVIKNLVEKVSMLRSDRNLFIHALWGEPFLKDDKVLVSCLEPKILSRIGRYGRTWASGREHEFELSYLISRIEEIEAVIEIQEMLLSKLESYSF